MNDIDLLRTAAAQIRERATRAATIAPGEWYADHTVGVYAYGDTTTSGTPAVVTDPRADLAVLEHIAGWGPEVALAVAAWLDDIATGAAAYNSGRVYEPHALAVARAVLAPTTTGSEVTA